MAVFSDFQMHFLQVSPEDLRLASDSVVKALKIREKYMTMSRQGFPRTTSRFLECLALTGCVSIEDGITLLIESQKLTPMTHGTSYDLTFKFLTAIHAAFIHSIQYLVP